MYTRIQSQAGRHAIATLAVWLIAASLEAASVMLEWDPPQAGTGPSSSTNQVCYRLYHGLASETYTEHVVVTGATVAAFPSSLPGCSNYFAVTAVDSQGVESEFSEEVAVYVPPAVLLSSDDIKVVENASATFQIRLDAQPANVTTVIVSRVAGGSPFLGIVQGAVLVFHPSNWDRNQTVTLAACYDPAKTNRVAMFVAAGPDVVPRTLRASSVGEAQSATEMIDGSDTDANGLPDAWEITRFGGLRLPGMAASDDSDHDGVSNAQEYIAGTDPADASSRTLLSVSANGGGCSVSFRAIPPAGSGYYGRVRYYSLEQCTNLSSGVWEVVPSMSGVLALGQTCSVPLVPAAIQTGFYRTRIRLE